MKRNKTNLQKRRDYIRSRITIMKSLGLNVSHCVQLLSAQLFISERQVYADLAFTEFNEQTVSDIR